MLLDVLIPTLNRSGLLERSLQSLLAAHVPPTLRVRITVINNGCTDDTDRVVRRAAVEAAGRLQMIRERRRGKSRALNAGLAATNGDVVGLIDDDEEVCSGWYAEIAAAFGDPRVEFVGGPYRPRHDARLPAWIPEEYLAVLGIVDNGPEPRDFGPDFPGILKGGNAAIRRSTLERVGPFAEYLGPSGDARLLSCEDEEMYHRLLKAGARGRYLPGMVIYHYVDPQRVTPRYYRAWCFWRGVSRGLMDRAHPLDVSYLGGVPRFLYGRAARGAFDVVRGIAGRSGSASPLTGELSLWDLAGYWYGKHVYPLARCSPLRSRRRLQPMVVEPRAEDRRLAGALRHDVVDRCRPDV